MATNRVYAEGRSLYLPVSSGIESGDPVLVEELPGVALTDRDTDGNATVDTGGAYDLTVKGNTGASTTGNKKVEIGAKLYYHDGTGSALAAGDLVPDATNGTFFGYALEEVASAGEATIAVKLGA